MPRQLPTTGGRTTVLVVEREPLLRRGITEVIRGEPEFEVCGEADSVTSALSAVAQLRPRLVTIELGLDEGRGLEAIGKIRGLAPQTGSMLTRRPPGTPTASLTMREFEVFSMLGEGLRPWLNADRLHRSVKTIETHRENIKHKLGLPDSRAVAENARTFLQTARSG